LFHIIGRDKRDALSFRQKASRSCVVQHSKIDLVMPGSGQKHALPRRNIDVRFPSMSRPRRDGLNATLW
jgi:hypothetical protein